MYGWWGGKGEQRAKRPVLGKVRMRRIKGAEEFLQKLTGQKTKQGTPGKKLAPLIPQRPPVSLLMSSLPSLLGRSQLEADPVVPMAAPFAEKRSPISSKEDLFHNHPHLHPLRTPTSLTLNT